MPISYWIAPLLLAVTLTGQAAPKNKHVTHYIYRYRAAGETTTMTHQSPPNGDIQGGYEILDSDGYRVIKVVPAQPSRSDQEKMDQESSDRAFLDQYPTLDTLNEQHQQHARALKAAADVLINSRDAVDRSHSEYLMQRYQYNENQMAIPDELEKNIADAQEQIDDLNQKIGVKLDEVKKESADYSEKHDRLVRILGDLP